MAKQLTGSRKGGRPTRYTAAIGDEIAMRIAMGESLRSICKDPKMPSFRTVIRWLMNGEPEEFWHQYARARSIQIDVSVDETTDLAKSAFDYVLTDQHGNQRVDTGAVQAIRMRIDNLHWMAERMLPKKYGTKVGLEHAVGGSLEELLQEISGSAQGSPMARLANKSKAAGSVGATVSLNHEKQSSAK